MFNLNVSRMGRVGIITMTQRIRALFANSKPGLWYDPSDLSTLFQDSAGTTPVTAVEQPVGKTLDKSGRGNHMSQATSTARPLTKSDSGVINYKFDGVDDGLITGAATFGSAMDCFMVLRRDSASQVVLAYPLVSAGANFFGVVVADSTSAATNGSGTPTYVVNGIDVPGGTATTRGQLHTATPVGQWCVVEVRNLNLSAAAWNAFGVGAYSSFPLDGAIAGIILCPAQSPETRTKIRRYLGAKVGLSL